MTYVREFPLKIIGGATEAKTQNATCTCMDKGGNMLKPLFITYSICAENDLLFISLHCRR